MSNDNNFIIALPQNGSVPILSVTSESQIFVYPSHASGLREVAFLGDKKHAISYASDFDLNIWCLQKQKHKGVLRGHKLMVQFIAVTSDSRYPVSGSCDVTIRIWDIKSKNLC